MESLTSDPELENSLGRELPIRLTTPMCDRVALHQGTFGHEKTLSAIDAGIRNTAPEVSTAKLFSPWIREW